MCFSQKRVNVWLLSEPRLSGVKQTDTFHISSLSFIQQYRLVLNKCSCIRSAVSSKVLRQLVQRSIVFISPIKEAVYWLDCQRAIAIFRDLLGVTSVVSSGRLVIGLVLFFPLIQLSMDSRS